MGYIPDKSVAMLTLVITLCLVTLAAAFPAPNDNFPTVPELDTSKYVGRWYQAYGNRYGWFAYGAEAVCITATYTAINSTTVEILNANRQSTGDGDFRSIGGIAWQPNPDTEPGKLFAQLNDVPFRADYWVVLLGDDDFMIGDKSYYDWAVVSNPSKESLFVLARDLNTFFGSENEQTVLNFLREEGFTEYFTRPIITDHPANCQYPWSM